MNRWLKYGLLALGALVVLLVVGAVIFASTFDPNKYKGQITEAVKKATGRELAFQGDMKVSVFPWIGAQVGGASLSNAPGFGDKPMVQFASAEVRIRLLPLLAGNVEVGRVVLQNLTLNLARNKDGVSNWDDLAGKGGEKKEEAPAKPGGAPGVELAVGGVSIVNANIFWDDAKANRHDAVRNVNVTIGAIAPGRPFDFDVAFGLESRDPDLSLQNAVKGTASLDLEAGRYTVKDLDLKVLATGKTLPGGKADVGVTLAQAAADVKAQTASLEGGVLRLDTEKLNFNAKVSDFAAPAVVFALSSESLDLDKILPRQASGAAAKPAQAQAGPEPDVIPVDTLRKLNLDGTVKIARLKVRGLTLTNLDVKILAKNGLLTVDPANLALYEGTVVSSVSLDARPDVPRTAVKATVSKVRIGPLLKDLSGKDNIDGVTDLKADLTTSGAKVSAMRRGLNGNVSLAVHDGAFPGVNLTDMVTSVIHSSAKSGTVQGKASDRTKFGEITGTAVAVNGVFTNRDLDVKSPNVRANGEGVVNLPANSVNYLVKAKLVAEGAGQGGTSGKDLTGLLVPVRVTGSLDNPSFGVDMAEYFKGAAAGLVKGVGGAVEGVGGAIGGAVEGIMGGGQKQDSKSSTTKQPQQKQPEKKGGLLDKLF